MEKSITKKSVHDEKTPPLFEDPAEAMKVFEALLERGKSFYPHHEASKGYPRVCRIIDLAEIGVKQTTMNSMQMGNRNRLALYEMRQLLECSDANRSFDGGALEFDPPPRKDPER